MDFCMAQIFFNFNALIMIMKDILKALGLNEINDGCSTGQNWFAAGNTFDSYSPVDGKLIAQVKGATRADYDKVINAAKEAFLFWREMPAPKRGEIVRQFGQKLRDKKMNSANLFHTKWENLCRRVWVKYRK